MVKKKDLLKLTEEDFKKSEEILENHYFLVLSRFLAFKNFIITFSINNHLPEHVEQPLLIVKDSMVRSIAADLLRVFDYSGFPDTFDLSDFIYSVNVDTPFVNPDARGIREIFLNSKGKYLEKISKSKLDLETFRHKKLSHADLNVYKSNDFPFDKIRDAMLLFSEIAGHYLEGWKGKPTEHYFPEGEEIFKRAGNEVRERLKW
jgi:hypothetical protein